MVVKDGQVQKPETDYGVANGGNSLFFAIAPANGASLFLVYLGKQYLVPTVDDGAISRNKLSQTLQRSTVGRWREVSSSETVEAGDFIIVNTLAAPVTLTLPANPSLGDTVRIIDGHGNFSNNNLIINPNGEKIAGVSGNQTTVQNRAAFILVYYNQANGWLYQ